MTRALTLYEALGQVPDPRSASGRRHPLQAVLTLSCVAMLAGARSLYAIAQFGRDRGREFARALGFTRDATPCCSTLHYLFAALDPRAFERAVRRWTDGQVSREDWEALSFDGKALRGAQGHELPGVRVLAAYAHEAEAVLGQVRVDAGTNEHKAALGMLRLLPLEGKLVMGDAAFCQRDLSRKVRAKKGTGSGR
jgi:hypothetical protein